MAWLVPAPLKADTEKATTLVFDTRQELKPKSNVLYRPYTSEITKPKPQQNYKLAPPVKNISTPSRWTSTAKGFPAGYCTSYVASKTLVTWRGNAGKWGVNAKAQGYQVDKSPQKGAILVTNEGRLGHVSFIEDVVGNQIIVSEMNYIGRGIVSTRTIDANSKIIKAIIHL